MKKIIKTKSGLQELTHLGLSRLAVQCYGQLWEHRYYMFAAELADALGNSPSNLYPALRQLEQCGLISRLKVPGYLPTSFQAKAV